MSTAVLIGKFQAPLITGRTKETLELLCGKHNKILILVHTPRWNYSRNSPLSYSLRAIMLRSFLDKLPKKFNYLIRPLHQEETADLLFFEINSAIKDFTAQPTTIYVGDDETWFLDYPGPHPYVPMTYDGRSNEDIRKLTLKEPTSDSKTSIQFRAGYMYANSTRPKLYIPTLSLLLITPSSKVILVKKRPNSKLKIPLAFPCGENYSAEQMCRKTAMHLFPNAHIDDILYLFSETKNNWLIENSGDSNLSLVFKLKLLKEPKENSLLINSFEAVDISSAGLDNPKIDKQDKEVLLKYFNQHHYVLRNQFNNCYEDY